MDKITQLEIAKMPDGGFAVCDGRVFQSQDAGRFASLPMPRFCCTTINEALDYIKRQMEPLASNG